MTVMFPVDISIFETSAAISACLAIRNLKIDINNYADPFLFIAVINARHINSFNSRGAVGLTDSRAAKVMQLIRENKFDAGLRLYGDKEFNLGTRDPRPETREFNHRQPEIRNSNFLASRGHKRSAALHLFQHYTIYNYNLYSEKKEDLTTKSSLLGDKLFQKLATGTLHLIVGHPVPYIISLITRRYANQFRTLSNGSWLAEIK